MRFALAFVSYIRELIMCLLYGVLDQQKIIMHQGLINYPIIDNSVINWKNIAWKQYYTTHLLMLIQCQYLNENM